MGQSRKDRTWEIPRSTRHVWVKQTGLQHPPLQGYVVDWRRHSYRWSALVVVAVLDGDGQPALLQRWYPAERLTPVKSDPNMGKVRYFG